jgi:hypothetical protein
VTGYIAADLAGVEEVLTDHLEAIEKLGSIVDEWRAETHQLIKAVRKMREDDQPAPVLRIAP